MVFCDAMTDRSRSRTVLQVVAAIAVSAIATTALTWLLLDVFLSFATRVVLTTPMRLVVVAVALLGVVPAVAGGVLRDRRPSTDFLQRR
jgi:high-affinity Fe2+/Pb2+ permease